MIYIYATLVKAGRRTLDQVPAHLREEVKKLLEEENDKAE
ncbi:CD1375 family protein [Peptococcus simiae]|uniref:CD1375 family protein n=1 Tax=Peptococcus simiae TaxID=1643805 RepID=A0ABW9GZY0_9FIRM